MLKYCGAFGFYLLKCEYIRNLKLILELFIDGSEKLSPLSTIISSGGGFFLKGFFIIALKVQSFCLHKC